MTTAALLTALEAFVLRFVIVPTHAAPTLALWVLHAWALEAFNYSPILSVTSPTPRCGKTLLLEVLGLLVPRSECMIRPSEAVLFRTIDECSPTLILDELDAVFRKENDPTTEGLRALLNAGNRRGATIPRCDGAAHKLRRFNVFAAKACGAIGTLPATVEDRAIPIRLARKLAGETVERFRLRTAEPDAIALRDHCEAWAARNVEALRAAEPNLPDELNDRQQDAWEPLLAIADLAGDGWPDRARKAALALHQAAAAETTDELHALRGLRDAFDAQRAEVLPTADVLAALVGREDAPFGSWWGRDVADGRTQGPAVRLARLLRPFGIMSKTIRIAGTTPKGYAIADCRDAFGRYLPATAATPPQAAPDVPNPVAAPGAEPQHRHKSQHDSARLPSTVAAVAAVAAPRTREREPGEDDGDDDDQGAGDGTWWVAGTA